jgi:hypothetical protein
MNILARFLLKRLHRVDPEVLAALKAALRDFNAKRMAWGPFTSIRNRVINDPSIGVYVTKLTADEVSAGHE